jgi:hypothetical protein
MLKWQNLSLKQRKAAVHYVYTHLQRPKGSTDVQLRKQADFMAQAAFYPEAGDWLIPMPALEPKKGAEETVADEKELGNDADGAN